MNRMRGTFDELSFDARMRRLRRSRQRLLFQRMRDNALWALIVGGLGIVIATELIAAVGRA